MKINSQVRKFFEFSVFIIAAGTSFNQITQACTGITLSAKDGTYIHARTMEFGVDPGSEVLVIPRGYTHVGTTPDDARGLKWKSKYASVGANAMNLPIIIDGVNEKGLSVGTFYFPNSAKYMSYDKNNAEKTIAPWELGSWILDNFSSVEEVRSGINNVTVSPAKLKAWGFCPPLHYIVTDASGKSLVVEYSNGSLHLYDDPLGVVTNSPSFDWHMTNLRNYVNFSWTNHPAVQLSSVKLEPFGQGSGMLGLPGDFTPPSRFVRAVAFSQSANASTTGNDAVEEAFHILNDFDIPKGSTREAQKDQYGNDVADYTIWTSAIDLKLKRFYFRTYENSQIRMIDLMKMNLDAQDIAHFSMKGSEQIRSLTP